MIYFIYGGITDDRPGLPKDLKTEFKMVKDKEGKEYIRITPTIRAQLVHQGTENESEDRVGGIDSHAHEEMILSLNGGRYVDITVDDSEEVQHWYDDFSNNK